VYVRNTCALHDVKVYTSWVNQLTSVTQEQCWPSVCLLQSNRSDGEHHWHSWIWRALSCEGCNWLEDQCGSLVLCEGAGFWASRDPIGWWRTWSTC